MTKPVEICTSRIAFPKISSMKFKGLLLLVFLFLNGLLNAQTDFRPGYVIKNMRDTIYGEIDYRGDLLMSSTCKFRDNDNRIFEFSPDDIAAFRFIDSKYYVSKEINEKTVFLEYLIKGKVNVYYMRDHLGNHYYLDKDDDQLTELPYEEEIKFIDSKKVLVRSTKHVGILSYYMQDVDVLQSRIQSIKKPEHKNLVKLAEDYHRLVCIDEECIKYEKNQPFIKIDLEVVSGVVNYRNSEYMKEKSYFQNGVIAYIWPMGLNQKLFFKTGILLAQVESLKSERYAEPKIPFHFGYLAPKSLKIRPSLSVGLSAPAYSGGVAVKINETFDFGVQSWIHYYSRPGTFFLRPSKLSDYSILANLYIDL